MKKGAGWRPYETMPKDRDVLIYTKSGRMTIGCFNNGMWRDWDIRWMPLPDPPE